MTVPPHIAPSASSVLSALESTWYADARQWSTFREFRSASGFTANARTIDLLAINTYPSAAAIVVVEVKVSRSDFLRELKDRAKWAKEWESATEKWYATPAGVVRPGEVPEGWGHVVVGADDGGDSKPSVRALVQPTRRPFPDQLPSLMLLVLARRAQDRHELPAGSWSLPSGAAVRAGDLRRLARKLGLLRDERNAAAPDRGDRTEYANGEMRPRRELGRIITRCEHRFQTRLRTVDDVDHAIARLAGPVPRDAHAAAVLRRLAEQLDPATAADGDRTADF